MRHLMLTILLVSGLGCAPAPEPVVESRPEPNVVDVVARGLQYEIVKVEGTGHRT
ncbi:MAG: hypothetical protein OEQ74_11880 [Gammaproteobacteria bacterium]|nr:hypothetical protein [Gammaproteobacteria bacterium]